MSKDRMELWLEGEKELFANMQKKLGGLGKAGREALQKGGMLIVNDAKVNLRNNRSVVTGLLRSSGKVQKVQGDEDAVDAGFFSQQTTGGYAKIGTLYSEDIPKFVQLKPGDTVRFQKISVEEAQSQKGSIGNKKHRK